MTLFSNACTSTTSQTLHLAVQYFENSGQVPPGINLKIIEELLRYRTKLTPIPPENTDVPHKKFIQENTLCMQHPEGHWSVILLGKEIGKGSAKVVKNGMLATADNVHQVAVAITRPQNNAKGRDTNNNEWKLLNMLMNQTDTGCVQVWATTPLSYDSLQENAQFISIQSKYDLDLHTLLTSQNSKSQMWPLPRMEEIQRGVVHAVSMFHAKGLIHCDIKPENIVLKAGRSNPKYNDLPFLALVGIEDPDIKINVKLIDLAFAAQRSDTKSSSALRGSPLYLDPEIALYSLNTSESTSCEYLYTEKTDVWNLGLTLLALENISLFFKVIPIQKNRVSGACEEFYKNYYTSNQIPEFPEPEEANPKLHMIWEMLQPIPTNRPTLEDVKKVFGPADECLEPLCFPA